MLPEFLVEVLAGIAVAVLSGLAGAAYQIHRRRTRPFLLLHSVDGYVLRNDAPVDFPAQTVAELAQSPFLHQPNLPYDLRDVDSVLETIGTLEEAGPRVLAELERAAEFVGDKPSDNDILAAVAQPLSWTFFDEFLMKALFRGKIGFEGPPPTSVEKIKVYEQADEDGHFQISFPGKPTRFAKGLHKTPYIRDGLLPFVNSIKTVDRPTLKQSLTRAAALLRADIARAQGLERQMQQLREENARWGCGIFVANYGETAMLVLPNATMQVKRGREQPILQPCNLVVYGKQEGKPFVRDEKNALLVGAGEQTRFLFVTSKLQREMAGGNELRGRFKDGQSAVRIVFKGVSPGLPATKTLKTKWVPFK